MTPGRLKCASLALLGTACSPAPQPRPARGEPPAQRPPETTTRTFTPSDARIENPERGFYRAVEISRETDLSWVQRGGDRLAFSYVRLDAFRASAIPEAALAAAARGLDAARDAGLKVILRFAYNEGPYPRPAPDAPLDRVLAHIRQVGPWLRAHSDAILLVQAGYIGAWGEWHSSTHGLDAPEAKGAVLAALLDALPRDRMTQLRYPEDRRRLFPGGLDDAGAFSGDPAARVGHHNDCFLASDTDEGTWPPGDVARWQALVASHGRFTPVGGESCRVNAPRTACPTALAEMERMHFSFINRDWHPDVTRRWQADGCGAVMERRLGYRFVLERAELPARVRAGAPFRVRVTLRNDGWAAMFNPRPVRLVVAGAGGRAALDFAGVDPRRWAPGQRVSVEGSFELPAGVAPGELRLALWLPDASARLEARAEYAVRFANDDVWTPQGWNLLGTTRVE